MYSEQQARIVKDYYQKLLADWELTIIFPKPLNEPIIGSGPIDSNSFDIQCVKGSAAMRLNEACAEFNLLKPYQLENLL